MTQLELVKEERQRGAVAANVDRSMAIWTLSVGQPVNMDQFNEPFGAVHNLTAEDKDFTSMLEFFLLQTCEFLAQQTNFYHDQEIVKQGETRPFMSPIRI